MTSSLGRSRRRAPAEVTDLDPQTRTQRRGRAASRGSASVAPSERFANQFESSAASMDSRLGALVEFGVRLAHQRDLLGELRTLAGRDFSCACALDGPACHRNVLLDVANLPASPFAADGRAMGITIRRPWASLLLVLDVLIGSGIENHTWATPYLRSALIYSGTRIDTISIKAAQRARLEADRHAQQQGRLVAAVLVDVHPICNCWYRLWGQPQERQGDSLYHSGFRNPNRLTQRTWGCLGGPGGPQPAGINLSGRGRAHS